MDEFREWLSDYLRYFMLGGAILLVLIVIIVGVRACSGGNKSAENSDAIITEMTTTETVSTEQETTQASIDNPLTDASEEITTLIRTYYQALGNRDVDTLRSIEVNFAPADEAAATNVADYIESYEVDKVYTKDGLLDGTYAVYATYQYTCRDVSTKVPGISSFYVVTDTDGTFKIQGSDTDLSQVKAYMSTLEKDADIMELTQEIKTAYENAKASDSALAAYLDNLGSEPASNSSSETSTEEEGTYMTTTATVNLRDGTDGGAIITILDYGTRVRVLGQESDWYQVSVDGVTGYIYSDYLAE